MSQPSGKPKSFGAVMTAPPTMLAVTVGVSLVLVGFLPGMPEWLKPVGGLAILLTAGVTISYWLVAQPAPGPKPAPSAPTAPGPQPAASAQSAPSHPSAPTLPVSATQPIPYTQPIPDSAPTIPVHAAPRARPIEQLRQLLRDSFEAARAAPRLAQPREAELSGTPAQSA